MVKITENQRKIQASSPTYTWEWDAKTDIFNLSDLKNRLISHACHRPLIVGGEMFIGAQISYQIKNDRIFIIYQSTENASRLTVSWSFQMDFISLEPLLLESPADSDIAQIIYFPEIDGDTYKPSMYSHYIVVPGLCMCTTINPVVDLHSRLSVTMVLGSGAMRGPAFRRNIQPIQDTLDELVEHAYQLCLNMTAMDNNFSIQQISNHFDEDIETMDTNIARAANDNEKKEFEETKKSLQARKVQIKNVSTLLSRFEAQLTGTNNAVDSVVTGIASLKGRDAKQIEVKVQPLLQVLQTEQAELKQFDAELEKTSLI